MEFLPMENTFWNITEVPSHVKQLKIVYIERKMVDLSHGACENPVLYAPFPVHFLCERHVFNICNSTRITTVAVANLE